MKSNGYKAALLGLAAAGMATSVPVEAKTHHRTYHHVRKDPGHGHCLRFNKTTGAIAGGAGGAILGKVILGGPVGIVAGAAGGALAGHALARNGRKRCR